MADPQGILKRARDARLVGPALAATAGFAVLVSLGNWQMSRRAWKADLTQKIAARGALSPLDHAALASLSCASPDTPDPELSCQFLPVSLMGRFDHARERHVYGTHTVQQGRSSVAGYFVFTPFRVDGQAYEIVVNRGFVPEEQKEPASRTGGQIPGTLEIQGIIRRAQPPSLFDARDTADRNIHFVRDPVRLGLVPAPAAATASEPPLSPTSRAWFYVDLAAPAPPGGLPRPSPGPASLTNRHLEYALTWYGLAATLVGVFAAFARTRLGRRTDR